MTSDGRVWRQTRRSERWSFLVLVAVTSPLLTIVWWTSLGEVVLIPGSLLHMLVAGGAHGGFSDWRAPVLVIGGASLFWSVVLSAFTLLSRRRRAD